MSPNAAGLQNFQYEKRNLLSESTSINQEKKKLTESSANPLFTSKVRRNYFPNNDNTTETIEQEKICGGTKTISLRFAQTPDNINVLYDILDENGIVVSMI